MPYADSTIAYTVKRYRGAKRVRISIGRDGTVNVSAPRFVPLLQITKIVEQHAPWIASKLAVVKKFPVLSVVAQRKEFLQYKEAARRLVHARLRDFATDYPFSYSSVSIRNQSTRWGSCSATGALSFNYKIVLLPAELADYVVVHELCHLQHMNHSPQFWQLVAMTIPDYKACRKRLRSTGLQFS